MQENIRFTNRDGETLAGVMHLPDIGLPAAFALFAHCFTCTKNIKAAVNIADALAQQGIATLRFDFTGLGQSEGDFADTHFSSNVEDLVDAAGWLEQNHQSPKVLVGHSLGGTAVLAAAHQIESAVAVATIGSPADAEHVLHLLDDELDTIEAAGEANVNLAGRPFKIKKDFVDNIRSQSVRDGIRSLRKALLVMHSPIDELVNVDEAGNIFAAALHPKSFVSLDDSDHLLSRETDSRYAGLVLAAWASRYLVEAGVKLDHAPYQPGAVVVEAKTDDGFLSMINADGHKLVADEPTSYGGTDRGPTPYDLLSAALGACTAMTLNMYARYKKLPVESVRVDTMHNKIHAKDCADCKTETGKVDKFERVVSIAGDITEQQRQRMLEIADRCPVHQTLHREVKVVSRLE